MPSVANAKNRSCSPKCSSSSGDARHREQKMILPPQESTRQSDVKQLPQRETSVAANTTPRSYRCCRECSTGRREYSNAQAQHAGVRVTDDQQRTIATMCHTEVSH